MQVTLEYKSKSKISETKDSLSILLAVPSLKIFSENDDPNFFKGEVSNPLLFRDHLLLLSEIVESRFYRPDLWRYLDPVITCESDLIRLECFSSCSSVYGRVDLKPELFNSGLFYKKGTTNVNFNKDFIRNLSTLRAGKKAALEVGEDFLSLETKTGKTIEQKVKLPDRWIKGFLQIQALHRKANLVFELETIAAKQFLASVSSNKDIAYLLPQGKSIKILKTKPGNKKVMVVSGLQRLKLFRRISPHIKKLSIFQIGENGATIWVAESEFAIATLGLSSSIKNGFSGEGEALRSLSINQDQYSLDLALHIIQNIKNFNIADLAKILELSEAETTALVDTLSMQGYLGYDSRLQSYFYRVLPFANKSNSRLINSKTLLENNKIELEECQKSKNEIKAKGFVEGKSFTYKTELHIKNGYLETGKCSCQWISEHGLKRGPCKHLLALRFFVEEN